jgi:hypothetical protein
MRCAHCGELLHENLPYCSHCGENAKPLADKTIADYFLWFVLGAFLNLFSIVLYAILYKGNPKKALAVLFGMFTLFLWYGFDQVINLIFK